MYVFCYGNHNFVRQRRLKAVWKDYAYPILPNKMWLCKRNKNFSFEFPSHHGSPSFNTNFSGCRRRLCANNPRVIVCRLLWTCAVIIITQSIITNEFRPKAYRCHRACICYEKSKRMTSYLWCCMWFIPSIEGVHWRSTPWRNRSGTKTLPLLAQGKCWQGHAADVFSELATCGHQSLCSAPDRGS